MDNSAFHGLLVACPIIQGLCCCIHIAVSRAVLYQRFGWAEYKTMGADKKTLLLTKKFQIFIALVKFGIIIYISYISIFLLSVVKNFIRNNNDFSALAVAPTGAAAAASV